MRSYFQSGLLLFLMFQGVVQAVRAQDHTGQVAVDLQAEVDRIFAGVNPETDPGAAVLVVRDQQVLLKRGYGLANLEHRIPMTPSTIFDVASLSKQFAGMAIAMLAESGRISLEDDVRAYIPEFPDFGDTVTIGHLVHHTSGLRDWPGTLSLSGWLMDDVISFDQILDMAFHQQRLNFEPGSAYSYTNTGYNILAEIVQRVSGQSFREWTDTHIFGPLGMDSTHFHDNHQEVVPGKASGYTRAGRGRYQAVLNGLTALGSSSLYTNINDLVKWVVNFETHRVGGQAVWERMLQRGRLTNGNRISYAYGLVIGTYRGLKTIDHSGGWAGFNTFLLHFPDQHFSVVVLTNHSSGNASKAAFEIADLYLANDMTPPRPDPENEDSEDAAEITLPATLLERYAGTYRLGPSWYITIRRKGNQLSSQATLENAVPIAALNDSTFRAYNSTLTFLRNAAGEVTGFRYRGMTCPRVELVPLPSQAELENFTGIYESSELRTSYRLAVRDGKLVASHPKHGSIPLTPAWKDEFRGGAWFMHTVTFTRDQNGQIDGFQVSQSRSRNQQFTRRKGL